MEAAKLRFDRLLSFEEQNHVAIVNLGRTRTVTASVDLSHRSSSYTFEEGMEALREAIKVMLRLVVPWRTVITYKEGPSPNEQNLCFAHFVEIPDPKELVILTDAGIEPDRSSASYQSFIRQLSGTNIAYQDTSKPYWRLYVTAHDPVATSDPSGHPFRARLTLAFNHIIYDGLCTNYFFEQLGSVLHQGSKNFDTAPIIWSGMPPSTQDIWKLAPPAPKTTTPSLETLIPPIPVSDYDEPERLSPFILDSQDLRALLEQCRLNSASLTSVFSVCVAVSCHYAIKDVGETYKRDVLTDTAVTVRPGMPGTRKLTRRQCIEEPLSQHADKEKFDALRNRWIGIWALGNDFKPDDWQPKTTFWQACADLRQRFPFEPQALSHAGPLPNHYDASKKVIWSGHEQSFFNRLQAIRKGSIIHCLATNFGQIAAPLESEWELARPLAGVSATEYEGISFVLTSLDDLSVSCNYQPLEISREVAARAFERLQGIIRRICMGMVDSEMAIHGLLE